MKQTQLFAKVRHNGSLDEDANFMTFGHSILTLMRCATGEGWNDIMHAIIDAQDQVRISLFSSLLLLALPSLLPLVALLFSPHLLLSAHVLSLRFTSIQYPLTHSPASIYLYAIL